MNIQSLQITTAKVAIDLDLSRILANEGDSWFTIEELLEKFGAEDVFLHTYLGMLWWSSQQAKIQSC